MTKECPLCKTEAKLFETVQERVYYKCSNCQGIFMDNSQFMSIENEKAHYSFHNNNANDLGYQNFVSPITKAILKDFNPSHNGLDFGSGTDSPIFKILQNNNYLIEQYDIFFHNYPELLDKQYDYIACCEVVEHFHHPEKEFQQFKKLLKPNGKLYIMTHLYEESIDFKNWYYIKDHTHVFIYQKETMQWIAKNFGFSGVEVEGRLTVFKN